MSITRLHPVVDRRRKFSFSEHIDAYILEKEMGGLSDFTLEGKKFVLYDFIEFLGGESRVENITPEDIREYLAYKYKSGCKRSTIRQYHTRLSSFFSWLIECEVIHSNPLKKISKPRIPKPLPRFLEKDEVNALLDNCGERFNGERLRAIVTTFMATGIRRSELCNLNTTDLSMDTGKIIIRNGKGGKDRMIPMDPILHQCLQRWLEVRARFLAGREIDALFVTRVCTRPSDKSIYIQIKSLGERAGVSGVTPHVLRHTFATMYIANGGSLMALKEILGHESLKTTQVYLHTSAKTVQMDLFRASPLRELGRFDLPLEV